MKTYIFEDFNKISLRLFPVKKKTELITANSNEIEGNKEIKQLNFVPERLEIERRVV